MPSTSEPTGPQLPAHPRMALVQKTRDCQLKLPHWPSEPKVPKGRVNSGSSLSHYYTGIQKGPRAGCVSWEAGHP